MSPLVGSPCILYVCESFYHVLFPRSYCFAFLLVCSGVGGGYGGPQSTGGGMSAGGGGTGGGPGNPGVQEGGGPQQYHPSPSALSAAAMVAAATATATATASVVALQERQEMSSQFSQVSDDIYVPLILTCNYILRLIVYVFVVIVK